MDRMAIVIPTFNAFDYAARACRSALLHTLDVEPFVVVVDDASPLWTETPSAEGPDQGVMTLALRSAAELRSFSSHFERHAPDPQRHFYRLVRFTENGGLTRSWNEGLRQARDAGCAYAVVTNSDVVFAPGWDREILRGLGTYDLVGPVTNAPGTEEEQYVGKYSLLYERSDDPKQVERVQAELHTAQAGRFKPGTLNGFCMAAKTETWWHAPYDDANVFRPRNDHNSKGQPNPTPLMTLNEYELQRRWQAAGRRSAIALGSYVFHYRAASRGEKYLRGDWVRLGAPP